MTNLTATLILVALATPLGAVLLCWARRDHSYLLGTSQVTLSVRVAWTAAASVGVGVAIVLALVVGAVLAFL